MSRLRLAVIGVGRLGRIHARLAAGLAEVELVAVVDGDRAACEAAAAETHARGCSDYRELFGEVDAAIVATPTSTHRRVAGDLLRGGIHAFVEKPLAPTTAEADELVQLARRGQLVLQAGHVERFNPGFESVRAALTDVRFVEARRQSGFTFRSTDVGVVMDLMIHDIDLALALVRSPVSRVDAVGAAVLGAHEDAASARLRFANGAVASLTASRVSYVAERSMHVFTPSRFAAIDFAARKATMVEPRADVLGGAFSLDGLDQAAKDSLKERLFDELLVKREIAAHDGNAIAEELRDFAAAIQTGRSPRVSGADGRDAVAVAEMILAEIRANGWDSPRTAQHGESPRPPAPSAPADDWSADDTVILRRRAG